MIVNYKTQIDQQIKRVKEDRLEMAYSGRTPEPGKLPNFDFMTRRIDAFDRNDVDPDNLKRIVENLMSKRV